VHWVDALQLAPGEGDGRRGTGRSRRIEAPALAVGAVVGRDSCTVLLTSAGMITKDTTGTARATKSTAPMPALIQGCRRRVWTDIVNRCYGSR
jgi:hypothetical protein